jgi:hypothetical protein
MSRRRINRREEDYAIMIIGGYVRCLDVEVGL